MGRQAVRRPSLQTTVQVREYSHWCARVGFLSPLSICTDEAGFSLPQPTIGREGHTCRGQGDFLFTAYFEHCVGFRSDTNANLMQDVCFLTERRKASFHSGSRFQHPAQLVARPVRARRQSVASETGSISGHKPFWLKPFLSDIALLIACSERFGVFFFVSSICHATFPSLATEWRSPWLEGPRGVATAGEAPCVTNVAAHRLFSGREPLPSSQLRSPTTCCPVCSCETDASGVRGKSEGGQDRGVAWHSSAPKIQQS